MWQLKKLSTNEALSKVGPLPNNWGSIFGLHGFLDKIGDLSWLGPDYEDMGWIELTDAEQKAIKEKEVIARIEAEKTIANEALNNPAMTVAEKIAWNDYILALDLVCLQADFLDNPNIPIKP